MPCIVANTINCLLCNAVRINNQDCILHRIHYRANNFRNSGNYAGFQPLAVVGCALPFRQGWRFLYGNHKAGLLIQKCFYPFPKTHNISKSFFYILHKPNNPVHCLIHFAKYLGLADNYENPSLPFRAPDGRLRMAYNVCAIGLRFNVALALL
jgi:hypothetical protein